MFSKSPEKLSNSHKVRRPSQTKGFEALISLPAGQTKASALSAGVSSPEHSGQPDREWFTEAMCESTTVERRPGGPTMMDVP